MPTNPYDPRSVQARIRELEKPARKLDLTFIQRKLDEIVKRVEKLEALLTEDGTGERMKKVAEEVELWPEWKRNQPLNEREAKELVEGK